MAGRAEGPDDLWASFPHDPRDRANARLRASDGDRDRVLEVITDAFADGRLEREELDERTSSATTARTLGDLLPLVSDLVPLRTPPAGAPRSPRSLVGVPHETLVAHAEGEWRERRRRALFWFVSTSIVTWLVWSAVGGGFPWPAIVSAVTLLEAVRVMTSREELVARDVRRLERRQTRHQRVERLHALRASPPLPRPQLPSWLTKD